MSNNTANKVVIKKSIIISIIVFFCKILGFLKQSVIAWAFGATGITDVYFAADGYISLFGQIQMNSISPSLLTEYVRYDEENNKNKINELVRSSFIVFPLISILLILVNVIFSGYISDFLGMSFTIEQKKEVQWYIIALCPVVFITALIGVAQGILDANEKFLPTKLLSMFFSVSIIFFVLFFYKPFGMKSMLIGFLVGYSVNALYVTCLSIKYFDIGFVNPFKSNALICVLRKIVPLVIGNSVVDLGHLVDRVIASSLVRGSVSFLYYGQVISSDIVSSIIISSIGTVLLPSISRIIARQNDDNNQSELVKQINDLITFVSAIVMVIVVLYFVEGRNLIRLFFQRGSFTENSTLNVTNVACCYAVGFLFVSIREILVKIHYGFNDTLSPMRNGVVGVIINIILSFILSGLIGVSGIALATSLSMAAVSFLMGKSLKKHIGRYPINISCINEIGKDVISAIVATLIGLFLRDNISMSSYIVELFAISILTIIVYIVCLIVFKSVLLKRFFIKNKNSEGV